MDQSAHEISTEECSDEVDSTHKSLMKPVEETVEATLMWNSIKIHLHKLAPERVRNDDCAVH